MPDAFPITIPDKLPSRIDPCPIVEAIFELRFLSLQPWENLPGLLYAQIRDRYPQQKNLPILQIPEEVRRQNPTLIHLPLIQFLGKGFLVQLGPRCIGLVTKPNDYPGWHAVRSELEWLIERLANAEFVGETERIGVRYIDFFDQDVFRNLNLHLQIGEEPFLHSQTDVTTILRRGSMSIRLHASNGAIVAGVDTPRTGSVLDVDAWFGALDSDVFENGLSRFSEAHETIKGLFFGLLKPDFLANFNPIYQ